MATNTAFETGRWINTVPTDPASGGASGDPALIGQLPGVLLTKQLTAATGAFANNSATIDTGGVYNLSVKGVDQNGNSAVAIGDIIYDVTGDTPKLSKKNTGVRFGIALGTVTSAATATIPVRVG